jgi:hypothetical protein
MYRARLLSRPALSLDQNRGFALATFRKGGEFLHAPVLGNDGDGGARGLSSRVRGLIRRSPAQGVSIPPSRTSREKGFRRVVISPFLHGLHRVLDVPQPVMRMTGVETE